ncbi:succinate dehydrogenase/fumarate reductase transmembrane subunit [Thermofilum pendens]|uniref:Succinate dehydrogenase subunit C n=1 Tax=Thermofilum pendens (strain DSM 2475 / Hrk 5) TaxID=368408 RepID=A1RZ93_THEPD|nr:succinate dehydrogenase cytochrome b-556 subunit [Thermofilum pendens]ABL78523.1 succinate dehydrogenase subunit C [Thermofilum pendens Hrk 5]
MERLRVVLSSWFRVKGRSLEHVSFSLRRLSGIVLALYFLVHMVDISTVVLGKEVYDSFLKVFTSPPAVLVDLFLWGVLVVHGVLGAYSAVVESGFLLEKRRQLLAASWLAIVVLFAVGAAVIVNAFR